MTMRMIELGKMLDFGNDNENDRVGTTLEFLF